MPATLERSAKKIPGRYIVLLKDDASKASHITSVKESAERSGGGSSISSDFVTQGSWTADVVNGYACKLSDEGAQELLNNPDVDLIAEDSVVTAYDTRDNAPWGLQRISQREKIPDGLQSHTYKFDKTASGEVDVYVVDTGIYTKHSDFNGRARWGYSSNENAGIEGDDHGHGTHVAGTIAGVKYGVAPNANVNLIGVKVLAADGYGSSSGIIGSLVWIGEQYEANGRRPTVVNMSLGGDANPVEDRAVAGLRNKGIHVVVAAGNDGEDASTVSPARSDAVITVGASDITDHLMEFRPKLPYASNYGRCLDIIAPGVDVLSCGIDGPDSAVKKSGTSMACPHVAGLVTYLILRDGNVKPDDMKAKIKSLATRDALTITNKFPGTVNLLAYNNSGA